MGYIYKIENLVNGKIYIGQTIRSIEERSKEHFRDAFRVKSSNYNCLLYRAIRKYGINNFSITKVEKIENNKLNEREQFWIAYYKSYSEGYNMNIGGDAIQPTIDTNNIIQRKKDGVTNETLSKEFSISKTTVANILHRSGINRNESAKLSASSRMKKIIQYNKDGKEIARYLSVSDAARQVDGYTGNIVQALKHKIMTAYGYIWLYEDEQNNLTEIIEKISGRNLSHIKPIEQYDLNGNLIATYNSIKEAINKLNLKSGTNISNVLNKRSKSAYGFYWKYKE